jgi:hydroxyacyl-ACP dehydratase HTD2-like protein with hotdog domain
MHHDQHDGSHFVQVLILAIFHCFACPVLYIRKYPVQLPRERKEGGLLIDVILLSASVSTSAPCFHFVFYAHTHTRTPLGLIVHESHYDFLPGSLSLV